MTKKREPTIGGSNDQAPTKRKRASKGETGTKSERGTAAGLRAGAGSATKAKARTSRTGKLSQKELTQRGGPGRAGTSSTVQKPKATKRTKTATRGRGGKARAGA